MKLILRVLALSSAMTVLLISANLIEKKQCHEFANICKPEVKATDQDVANVCDTLDSNKKFEFTTSTSKCFFECIHRHLNYLTADRLNEKEIMKKFKSQNLGQELLQAYQTSAHGCNEKHNLKDKCENAVVLTECMVDNVAKNMMRGLNTTKST